ncbi:MAG: translational GTPase TypA [Immundisolibacteraceae bacterium]|nr:translational GTPase TypA [Immundisolibacteraceae bacterium]
MSKTLRNIAIIAHVDHGKTTLVDCLLKQSGTFADHQTMGTRVMDSNDQERERGITITSKNTAITWGDHRINIVDTPGHADFGGEVERILSMVDSVLLLVDAVEGPMPQTRFVTEKAFAMGLSPLVVINKIDRDGSRPDWVLDATFDLFDSLGATDEQLDFPVIYASAIQGFASNDSSVTEGDMQPLIDAIEAHVPAPAHDVESPFQMRISALDYSSYVGVIGVGRIQRGSVSRNQLVTRVLPDGKEVKARVLQVLAFQGLERVEVDSAEAGDIVAVTGIEGLGLSDTLCDPEAVEALPALAVDEPTVSMNFEVNKSPLAGRDGKYLTSRQIRERLDRELITNIALRVSDGPDPDIFIISGRGELHLSILIETMRREGYELAVSRPQVIYKEIDGKKNEPWELLTIDVDNDYQGAVMELMSDRGGELQGMEPGQAGRVRLEYRVPTRGLIGLRTVFMTTTSGTGLMNSVFEGYAPMIKNDLSGRNNGVFISNAKGKAVGFALFNLQERGKMLVVPGDEIYEGMIVGIHSRDNDLVVNPMKAKQLTNVRASGTDEAITLVPITPQTLEQALEFIADDELVEVTPETIRVRKRFLLESDRKRASRGRDR